MPKVALKNREGLSLQQERFITYYLIDGNATQAAIEAGYAKAGAHVQASRLLTVPKIQAAIEAKKARLAAAREVKLEVTKEYLLRETIDTYKEAREKEDYGPARGLIELAAKLQGLIIERKDVRMIARIEDLRDEELEAIVAQAERDKGK